MISRRGTPGDGWWRLLRLAGAAALIATGGVHLDLYLTGYRTIPTIGWLFVAQVISDAVLAVAVTASARRRTSALGAGLLLSTLGGYLLALAVGLFGFREVRTTAGLVAGIIEIVGFVALAGATLRPYGPDGVRRARYSNRSPLLTRRSALVAGRCLTAVIAVQLSITLGLLFANADAASTTTGGATIALKVADVHGVSVLTNARGFTLYWFAPDSSDASHCYGTCAAYWPPVLGSPSTSGVAGTFGTLRRSDGTVQATYDGHPLYTYVGDAAPGQASGNDIDLNGGTWYEMKWSK